MERRTAKSSSLVITLSGNVPSKKNSKSIIRSRDGKMRLISSKAHREWWEEKMWKIKQYKPRKPIEHCFVTLSFYPSTKRKADCTNKAESIMDLLVDAGIILDDNWFIVPKLLIKFVKVDRKNPSTIIKIQY